MSQKATIKELLLTDRWVCSSEILEKMFIVDYRRRICDLKDDGMQIESRPCIGCGRTHKAKMYQYHYRRNSSGLLEEAMKVFGPKEQVKLF